MLTITIPMSDELWDEEKEEFISAKEKTLQLEHSLVSISKWESKWNKSFLETKQLTYEETIDYIRCMTLTQNVDPEVYGRLTSENIRAIDLYIDAPMTATTFSGNSGRGRRSSEGVTAEIIYYWMVALNIPFECQKWHLNRLLTLIRVCNIKSQPPKKRNQRDMLRSRAALNAERKRRWNTKG